VLWKSSAFVEHDVGGMTAWLIGIVVSFAVIFAINSSIHSYLVVKYASNDKVAVSVGFYYMSNAVGRLFGTLGSGILYTYSGGNEGQFSGSNGTIGLAVCFAAGTVSSLLAALITVKIDDDQSGFSCGKLVCIKPKAIVDAGEGEDPNDNNF